MTAAVTVNRRPFGNLPDGRAVDLYAITSEALELHAITYGGIITSLRTRDHRDRLTDVVLGYDTLQPYLTNPAYFGAVIGRYANRIAGGRFELDGVWYQLATNDGHNHLHGGILGFDRQLWTATPVSEGDAAGISFTRISPSGEEHYPGTLDVGVRYVVAPQGTIKLDYEATTDSPTIVNLTQHTYFNLAGEPSTNVLGHDLQISADEYTPVGATLIPTGEIESVKGTPFDFRSPARLGPRVVMRHEQLGMAGGFDHNYALRRPAGGLAPAAELRHTGTGRVLKIATTEPGLQLYTGQLLDGRTSGAYGRRFDRYAGLCLETQHFPDSPNHPHFPAVVLRPGERYRSTTIWEFGAP